MGNYGRTENVGGRELATASSLVGSLVGSTTANATFGTPATMSTAPYIPPKPKVEPHPNGDERLCHFPGCRGLHTRDTKWCWHHPDGKPIEKSKPKPRPKSDRARCAKPDCKGWCKGETPFCRHHQDWKPE